MTKETCCLRLGARNALYAEDHGAACWFLDIDLFAPAAVTLLLLFFFGGPKQLVKSPQINRVRFAQGPADSPQGGGSGRLDDLHYVGGNSSSWPQMPVFW